MLNNLFLKKIIAFIFIFFTTIFFCVSQTKQTPENYAPRMEEFENIDRDVNFSSVKSGVSNSLEETLEQFIKSSKILTDAGIDNSELRKLLKALASELDDSAARKDSEKKSENKDSKKNLSPNKNIARQKAEDNKNSIHSKTNLNNQSFKKAIAIRKEFVEYSLSLRGIPYKSGCASPESGFDCSGFVQYAVKNSLHRKMPRTANEMYTAMEKAEKLIADSDREPGDLVFFKENPFGKITHVGIYLGKYRGSGRLHGREIFVNAASAGPRTGVVISALDEPYWKRTYYKSGRFLPQTKPILKAANSNNIKR